ncbi:hypothetical protein K491DRAFT_723338 [Lophiostoma macrostomum CBS 122681]|uniref:Uncharacterized protein n=1 Tax=Lophiostoma macrostomum CBS 122681 TaxID=1314788 RepID=A0A6A6SIG5_9PLEO|nr:hypothetical protein K491DRAFT_723338 [Lophiostoma macrostomum CBS 122681]
MIGAILCALLAIAITALNGAAVKRWDDNVPGRCYRYFYSSSKWKTSDHWRVSFKNPSWNPIDRDYAFTAVFLVVDIGCLVWAIAGGRGRWERVRKWSKGSILSMVLVQYVYHLIFLSGIRHANQGFLEGGDENQWSLGQIMAAVMLLQTFAQLAMAFYGTKH